MKESTQGRYALLIVFISFILVIGSIITAFAETGFPSGESPQASPTQIATDFIFITITNTTIPTFVPSDTPSPPTPTTAVTLTPTTEKPILTLTPTLTASSDTAECTQPSGWITYTVRSGDNLYKISKAFGVTVAELQAANCLGNSTTIITGSKLWVPNVATITYTPTKTEKPTKAPTITPIPSDTPEPTNSPPVANPDTYSVVVGDNLDINSSSGVLSNDTDVDNNPLTATLVDAPICATASAFTLFSDGSFTYTADLGACAATDTFTYKANDGSVESNLAIVTINLQ